MTNPYQDPKLWVNLYPLDRDVLEIRPESITDDAADMQYYGDNLSQGIDQHIHSVAQAILRLTLEHSFQPRVVTVALCETADRRFDPMVEENLPRIIDHYFHSEVQMIARGSTQYQEGWETAIENINNEVGGHPTDINDMLAFNIIFGGLG